jgi:hypothetical protein
MSVFFVVKTKGYKDTEERPEKIAAISEGQRTRLEPALCRPVNDGNPNPKPETAYFEGNRDFQQHYRNLGKAGVRCDGLKSARATEKGGNGVF